MKNSRENEATVAANFIRLKFPKLNKLESPIGLVLGTGWDVLSGAANNLISFSDIPGFSDLEQLDGHARQLLFGNILGRQVLVLRGRIHLNEAPNNSNIARIVRLQIEMLFKLGVKKIIVTSAVGSLDRTLEVGSIAVIDGFVTVYAPDMPLWAGEFCSPDDTLSKEMMKIAIDVQGKLKAQEAGHVMLRRPFFEGRRYDKQLLIASGAKVVGMSMLPEACIAALYGVEFLGLGFITNTHFETHSHEDNLARAKKSAKFLKKYLIKIISRV